MVKIKNEERGFTLIELMVTLALVGLVIIGGLNLYFFADRSFVSGTITADVQAEIQLAMKRMTEELRLAHRLEFVESVPASSTLQKDDHYLFVQDGLVYLRTQRPVDQIVTNINTEIANYAIEFDRSKDDQGGIIEDTLRIKLSSLNPRVPYSLESDIQVLNLRLSGIEGDGPAEVVYFTKTLSEVEREEAQLVRSRCFIRRVVFNPNDPEVFVLQDFRDRVLKPHPIGRVVTDFYYAISPSVAKFLEVQPLARVATKSIFKGIATVITHLT